MATEQERKDKVKAEDLQKAVIVALQTVEDVRHTPAPSSRR